jgi:YidC/Oxa1 family membrane protein insertase
MTDPTFWNQVFIWPILNALVAFYKLFEFLSFPGPLGFSIIEMTITMRFILWPFMAIQMKSAKKMQKIKPHMDELSKKHKDDKSALQKAQMELYKEHGINPAAGCLPLLLQMPVLIALYNVFYQVFNNTDITQMITNINQVVYIPSLQLTSLDLTFLGINLALKPSQWQTAGYWLFAIPILTGLLQWYQTQLMIKQNTASATHPVKAIETKKNQKDEKEEPKPDDMAGEIQKQMAIISPIMFGFFAYQFPIGLALYWNVFGLFGIIQQRIINKKYG